MCALVPDAAKVLNWKYGSNIGSTLKSPDLYNFFNEATPVISFCKVLRKSHWSAKLVLIFCPEKVFNSPLIASDLFLLSGDFLLKFFKFLVFNSAFFCSLKLINLLPKYPPAPPTKNPKPPAVNATVPVLIDLQYQ